jgi:hypothetical protein
VYVQRTCTACLDALFSIFPKARLDVEQKQKPSSCLLPRLKLRAPEQKGVAKKRSFFFAIHVANITLILTAAIS